MNRRLGDYGKTVMHFMPSHRTSPYVPADHVHIWQEWGKSHGVVMVTWQQCQCGARTDMVVTPNPFLTESAGSADRSRAGYPGFLRRVADWCVPASALNWGKLTADPPGVSRSLMILRQAQGWYEAATPTVAEVQAWISPDLTPHLTADSFRGFKPDEDA